jgi:aryl-alcohol dehydrogenase-like predicted oxidoreductase
VEDKRYTDRYGLDSDYATADAFTAFAAEAGVKPATLAVAWVMAHPAVTAPIIGARNLSQLADSLAAVDLDMPPALRAEISALSATPAPANDRTETLTGNWS